MKAREYLEQIKIKDSALANLRNDKETITQMLYSFGGSGDGERVQSSRNNDKFGTLFGRIDEIEQRVKQEMVQLIEFKLKVSGEINALNDARYIELLHMRYIEFKSWECIASDMGYNTRYTLKLHGHALEAFQKQYKTMLSGITNEMEVEENGRK